MQESTRRLARPPGEKSHTSPRPLKLLGSSRAVVAISLSQATPQKADGFRTIGPAVTALVPSGSPERDELIRFVSQILPDMAAFNSPQLLCESIVKRSWAATSEGSHKIRVAAACWALNILVESSVAIRLVRDELLPALFVNYQPPPQCLSTASTLARASLPEEIVLQNPFFSHDLICSVYSQHKVEVEALRTKSTNLAVLVSAKREAGRRLIARWKRTQVAVMFSVWKEYTRQQRVEAFTSDRVEIAQSRRQRVVLLQAAFYCWRVNVELARESFLDERLQSVAYQLENAKNQFQLQCHRSDKYLRTVEELRTEVQDLHIHRDDLKGHSRDLERKLREFQEEARKNMNSQVDRLLHIINNWRAFARASVEELSVHKNTFNVVVEKGEEPAPNESDSGEELEAIEGPSGPSSDVEVDAEKLLLRWVNSVLRDTVVSGIKHIDNFTDNYMSGEVILLLLHHVFPNDVPYSPLQEANIPNRLEAIIELGKKVGIAHLPTPRDVMDGVGDMNVLLTAELFSRFVARQGAEKTRREAAKSQVCYDIDMLEPALVEAETEMKKLLEIKSSIGHQEDHLKSIVEGVTRYAAYLMRERLSGNPVVILDRREVTKYCKMNNNRYRDISYKYPADKYSLSFDEQLAELKKLWKKYFHHSRRIFTFYAQNRPTMLDTEFWRLCADIRAVDKGLSRFAIDKIFSIANADDVPLGGAEDEEAEQEDEDNPATELVPSEFMECMVRMADLKIPGKMLHERYEQFMNMYVIPFACKSETDKFKKEIYDATTQAAVRRYLKDYTRLFQHYAKLAGSKGKKSISTQDFVTILKEGNAIGGTLDENAAQSTARNIVGEESNEMTVHEFLEGIIAASAFKVPSPFISLDKKVDVFSTQLLSSLRLKLKGTVPLSDYKVITVQQLQKNAI